MPAPKLPHERAKSTDAPPGSSGQAEEFGEECGGAGEGRVTRHRVSGAGRGGGESSRRVIIRAPVNGSVRGRASRAWVEVNLAAVIENARTVARTAGTRLLPVVKANAYGVGAVAVCKALEALDPWGYGVATVQEGAELRAAGITRPVIVFMPVQPALLDQFNAFGLTPVLGDADSITSWTARGERAFHLEIDTGMGRSGVRWDEIEALRGALDTPRLEGCYTQFH